MGRRADACVGRCNGSYHEAWDAYQAAHQTWTDECATQAVDAAETLAALPGGRDARLAFLDALGLPEPPAVPDVEPVAFGEPVWCTRCTRRIRAALVDIGDLAAVLNQWADGHRGQTSGELVTTHRSDTASPSPIGDTLDDLYGKLAAVEAGWRKHSGHQPRPNRARTDDARERTLAYLHLYLDDILKHPGSVAFGRGVLAWQTLLQKMSKTDPVVRRRPGRCPRCQCVNVLQTRDDGYTECRSCGRLMNEGEYERDVVGSADTAVVAESQAERQAS